MPGKMICMSMGDKSMRLGIPRVQPEVELGQMQASLESNFNQLASKLDSDLKNRQGKPHF